MRKGEEIVQETRRFDQTTGRTTSMRRKEDANDYRYFPDPDLAPIVLAPEMVAEWGSELPLLPDARKAAYMRDYGLTSYAAEQLVSEKALADYFETAAKSTGAVRTLANLMISEVFRLLDGEEVRIPVAPVHLAAVATLTEEGVINSGAAKKTIAALWTKDEEPIDFIEREGLRQLNDPVQLGAWVRQAVTEHPDMVESYRRGKLNLKKALMGAAMSLSGGMANPVLLQQLMDAELDG